MEPNKDIVTLSELGEKSHGNLQWFNAVMGKNLGSATIKLSMPLKDFSRRSHVSNKFNNKNIAAFEGEGVAQRALDNAHAKRLAQFTLMGLLHAQVRKLKAQGKLISPEVEELMKQLPSGPYTAIQPITCNIRDCEFGGGDLPIRPILDELQRPTGVFQLGLSSSTILHVVDGQHRKVGFEMVTDFLEFVQKNWRYPKVGIFRPIGYTDTPLGDSLHDFWQDVLEVAIVDSEVCLEVHLGLNLDQEQQMFVDLNQKGKKPTASYVNSFDHADPVNTYIRTLLDEDEFGLKVSEVDQSDWHKDDGSLKRKDLKNICSLLFHGKLSSNGITPMITEGRKDFVSKFWERISQSPHFGSEGARSKTILQQPIVLQSLAKLVFDLAFGVPNIRDEDGLKSLYSKIQDNTLDFSHQNPIWRALFKTSDERKLDHPGIEKFVHVPAGTNLDAGNFDEENAWVRFGSRHSDIRPRLGDVVRFEVGLRPRDTVTKAIERESLAQSEE